MSKLERFQLLEVVAELQLKQPEEAAMADPSGTERERQLQERERELDLQSERIGAPAQKGDVWETEV